MAVKASFYEQIALVVAEQLIGMVLVRNVDGIETKGRIVETEAYIGPEDKGCHAYGNRRTKRTETMFFKGGHAYVYLIYGLHYCFNIVTAHEGKPEAVLIRALEPIVGIEYMQERRGISGTISKNLTNGPGKLCQAMAIDASLNGHDMVNSRSLFLEEQAWQGTIQRGKRVNINYAEEYEHKLWRFYAQGNPYVSVQ